MNLKKIVLIIVLIVIFLVAGITIFKGGSHENKKSDKIQVVVSNFASYDFVRAIVLNCSYLAMERMLKNEKILKI